MARIIVRDFNELIKFIEGFSLQPLLSDSGYKKFISTYHKKYFGFLLLSTELEHALPQTEYLFIKEANSDLITCLFHLTTGNYKSAKLLLRSSIECFWKGFCLNWVTNIDKVKSVYEIFDKVRDLPYFSNEPFRSEFVTVHDIYKLLCKDVHVADKVNMTDISSMNFFPKYIDTKSNEITNIVLKLIPVYCFLLAHKFNSNFHKIHHSHREIILSSIKRKLRPIIMNTAD